MALLLLIYSFVFSPSRGMAQSFAVEEDRCAEQLLQVADATGTMAVLPAVGSVRAALQNSRRMDLRAGCSGLADCPRGNNTNRYYYNQADEETFLLNRGCLQERHCPSDMVWVCDPEYFINICIDRDLLRNDDGNPRANITYAACQAECQGRRGLTRGRIPTNTEWLVAANGTSRENCLPSTEDLRRRGRISHPCPNGDPTCMHNDRLNAQGFRQNRNQCVSIWGMRDAVGVLGQWVQRDYRINSSGSRPMAADLARPYRQRLEGFSQFNGGLWPRHSSSIFYTTIAHNFTHYDYSVGCRCASDPSGH